MSLVKKTVTFDVGSLLDDLIEVSRYNLERINKSVGPWPEMALTHANLGRGVGHTSAIVDYIKGCDDSSDVLVVAPNRSMAAHIKQRVGPFNCAQVDSVTSLTNDRHFKLLTTGGGSHKVIIFDACNLKHVYEYIAKYCSYTVNRTEAIVGLGLV